MWQGRQAKGADVRQRVSEHGGGGGSTLRCCLFLSKMRIACADILYRFIKNIGAALLERGRNDSVHSARLATKCESARPTPPHLHTQARIGELKPHRRNFRKNATGHVSPLPPTPAPNPQNPDTTVGVTAVGQVLPADGTDGDGNGRDSNSVLKPGLGSIVVRSVLSSEQSVQYSLSSFWCSTRGSMRGSTRGGNSAIAAAAAAAVAAAAAAEGEAAGAEQGAAGAATAAGSGTAGPEVSRLGAGAVRVAGAAGEEGADAARAAGAAGVEGAAGAAAAAGAEGQEALGDWTDDAAAAAAVGPEAADSASGPKPDLSLAVSHTATLNEMK